MNVVLLDTDIVSFLFKGDKRLQLYTPHLKGQVLAVSFMTVAELFQWSSIRKWGAERNKKLEETLNHYLIFPCTIELCRTWGNVRAKCRGIGHPISAQDAWIAATALHYNIPLATHNISDFKNVEDLKLIQPETS